MPNVNRPSGFSPVNTRNSGPYNGQANLYWIPSTDTNQYNLGDAVKSASGSDAQGVPKCVKITNGTDTVRGVVVGAVIDPTNLNTTVIPATKTRDYYLYVCDDPEVVYEVTDDGNAGWSAAAVGKNCSFTVANPTAPSQLSASVLAFGTLATTAGLNVKILGVKLAIDNSPGPYCRWLVKFNQSELQGNTAGV